MKKEIKNDLRYRKTEELIRTAFQQMLLEMDYSQIMIKGLAERAQINRKTFYLHYATLDDLLAELQEEMGQQFLKEIAAYHIPEDMEKIVQVIFLRAEANGTLGERILCSHGHNGSAERAFARYVQTQTWKFSTQMQPPTSTFATNLVVAYLSNGINEIYRQWVADNRQLPLKDAVKLTAQLLTEGLSAVFSTPSLPV